MSREVFKKITRRYRITEKDLKEKLKMVGDVAEMVLSSGLSMDEEREGLSHDMVVWEFVTIQTSGDTRQ